MSTLITILSLFVLGILGLYLLKIARGVAYVVFLLALGFGMYRFAERYIFQRPIDIPTEVMVWKEKWSQGSLSEFEKAMKTSSGVSLATKVKTDLASSALAKTAQAIETNSGFFLRVKTAILELFADIRLNIEKL